MFYLNLPNALIPVHEQHVVLRLHLFCFGSEGWKVASNDSPVALVAEDDYQVREFVTALLERKGFRVLSACNGNEALRLCENQPDLRLVLTDGELGPGPNGIQLADILLKTRQGTAILVIAGTPEACVKAAERNLEFLLKPFMIGEFYERLKKLTCPIIPR